MSEKTLFPLPEEGAPEQVKPQGGGTPRVRHPNRHQIEIRPMDLDSLIPEDHSARAVWAYVESLDLSAVYEKIRAVQGHAGRTPIDPKIQMALWLYATIDGVGSARELERLCEYHHAYQWICGGVNVNYHTLSDFRTGEAGLLDELLSDSVAVLMKEGLVELNRVAQDGVRVRASAGAASFRREKTLRGCLEEAEEQVKRLRKEIEEDPGAGSRRRQARRERAGQERKERVEKALEQLPEVKAKKKPKEKPKARVSTSDPEARVMKMADGGFRPAYNLQFSVDTASQVIVGVDATKEGSDQGQMGKMVEQIEKRHGKPPEEMLVDGGFAKHEDIEKVSGPEHNCTVYAPVPKPKDSNRDPHKPRSGDSEVIGQWRERMGTAEAKEIYKERAATAECVNAIARNRGLQRFLVRGLRKIKAIALWFALAHNMMRAINLRASVQQAG